MKALDVWYFENYRSWQNQLCDEVSLTSSYWNRQERKTVIYERFFNVLEKAAKENRCFCEVYDRYGDLCLTTRYSRKNNEYECSEEGSDGRIIKALLKVTARKSSLRKVDATGPYVVCFYMKVKGEPDKLITKFVIKDTIYRRLLMDDDGVKYNNAWVFRYEMTNEVWTDREIPKKEFCKDRLALCQ